MRANASATEEDKLTDEEVYAQIAYVCCRTCPNIFSHQSHSRLRCSTLTFAAMDTTSSALSRIISLLADHQDAQEKLRTELVEAKRINGGKELDYDQLVGLPYLDAVCRETLRV